MNYLSNWLKIIGSSKQTKKNVNYGNYDDYYDDYYDDHYDGYNQYEEK